METKIDLKSSGSELICCENNKRHHDCKQCRQPHCRSTAIMGAVFLLGTVTVMLFCWNYLLYQELIKVRSDVNAFLSSCERIKEKPRDHSHVIEDTNQDNAVEVGYPFIQLNAKHIS